MAANKNITDPNKIQAGMKLNIGNLPKASTYAGGVGLGGPTKGTAVAKQPSTPYSPSTAVQGSLAKAKGFAQGGTPQVAAPAPKPAVPAGPPAGTATQGMQTAMKNKYNAGPAAGTSVDQHGRSTPMAGAQPRVGAFDMGSPQYQQAFKNNLQSTAKQVGGNWVGAKDHNTGGYASSSGGSFINSARIADVARDKTDNQSTGKTRQKFQGDWGGFTPAAAPVQQTPSKRRGGFGGSVIGPQLKGSAKDQADIDKRHAAQGVI
jgi:hypothetical protein